MKQVKIQSGKVQNLFIRLVLMLLLTSGAMNMVHAQNSKAPSGSEVKYVGFSNGRLVFQIDYINEASDRFNLEIRDSQGYTLYNEVIKAKKYTRQYAIENYDMENNSLTFFIKNKNKMQKFSFVISTTLRVEVNSIAKH